jgi:hypothetical protein
LTGYERFHDENFMLRDVQGSTKLAAVYKMKRAEESASRERTGSRSSMSRSPELPVRPSACVEMLISPLTPSSKRLRRDADQPAADKCQELCSEDGC